MGNQLEELGKACDQAAKVGVELLKSHVKQYTRADGTMVQEHDDSRQASKRAEEHSEFVGITGNHLHHYMAQHAHEHAANVATDRKTKDYHKNKAAEHEEKGDIARDKADGK